jgi:hypothetical protein
MDPTRFDSLSRVLAAVGSRRALALALSGALVPLIGPGETEARKTLKQCRKIDDKQKRKKCIKKAKRGNQCQDGKQNGSESDIDCGGGKCPRCTLGQTCASRDDCDTGRCTGGTCQACVNNDPDCGLGADGQQCFCRPTPAGHKICTRQLCKLFLGGSCADCLPGEQCTIAGGGADRECCIPCGA